MLLSVLTFFQLMTLMTTNLGLISSEAAVSMAPLEVYNTFPPILAPLANTDHDEDWPDRN